MLVSLGVCQIKNELDLHYLKLFLDSHKEQTVKIPMYLSISTKANYREQIKKLSEKYSDLYYVIVEANKYFFENLFDLYNTFKSELQQSWILFSEFGIWHHKRAECYQNCLNGMENFKPKERNSIKYIRIPRSVYTGEKLDEKCDYSTIDKFLSEGQIVSNENSNWGEISEYVVRNEVFLKYCNKLSEKHQHLLTRPNCARYFLKYINCNGYKFLHLNTEKITIDFWMFFYFYNEPNTYFKPTRNIEVYEDSFQSIIDNNLVQQKSVVYETGSKVTTSLGPGVIENIVNGVYKIKINWEDEKEDKIDLCLKDLHQFDKNESRKGLYLFIANLLNNIELYLTNFVFSEDVDVSYENFRDIITQFIIDGKAKMKSDNLFEKLGTLLDYRERVMDEKIYHNNLTKNIFNHVVDQSIFKEIKKIEKID